MLHLCNFCGKGQEDFSTRAKFLEHYKTHQGVEHSCDECDAAFATKSRLYSHLKHSHGNYTCQICKKVFSQYGGYLRHKKSHEEKEFLCTYCPKSFYRKDHLKIHEKVHINPDKMQQKNAKEKEENMEEEENMESKEESMEEEEEEESIEEEEEEENIEPFQLSDHETNLIFQTN